MDTAQTNLHPFLSPSIYSICCSETNLLSADPIRQAAQSLEEGKIIAIKDLGGFYLICDATNALAIASLREKKHKPDKPLAVMFKDIATARKVCYLNEKEEEVLLNPKGPIVLAKKRKSFSLPENIAPRQKNLGVMLSHTSLHRLLFTEKLDCLIITSGNVSGMPIQYKNDEAFKNLHTIADYFLFHDHDIRIPLENSVVKVLCDKEVVLKRSLGYAPYQIPFPIQAEIFAVGCEQKNSFCLSKHNHIVLSPYIGDLKDSYYQTYDYTVKNLKNLFTIQPKYITHDLHPHCLSTQYAEEQQGIKIPVQHHHAHMVSCMVEHNLYEPCIGIIYDGIGLGTDHHFWGGEFFIGTRRDFKRIGHFKYVSIQGGEQAVKEPWKTALSYLHGLKYPHEDFFHDVSLISIHHIKQALKVNLNCYLSSSVGRLFDCVAALTKVCHKSTYDSQAGLALENILEPSIKQSYCYTFEKERNKFEVDYKNILYGVLQDIKLQVPPSVISAKFHNTLINLTVDAASKIREAYHISTVVLSGSVFENSHLLINVIEKLSALGFSVYYNQQIPINDSGIAVGQLAIANEKIKE